MATTKQQLEQILLQMPCVGDVSARGMMGEYLLYYRGRLFGGVYDGRLLVKDLPSAKRLLSSAPEVIPYPGAKAMLEIRQPEPALMLELLEALYPELPEKKKK